MDAKERHELKDNDLAEFLENFGSFWDKHGNWLSILILVAVGSWFGIRYYNNMQTNRHEAAWWDLDSTTTPQGFRERARDHSDTPGLANVALLRGAEAYHQQAVKLGNEGDDPESGVMSAQDSLDNAEKMYKQVLESQADAVYRANAAVGLANVAETRGDFAAAGEYWKQAEQIADEARLGSIGTQAQIRVALLDNLAKPIVFGEAPTIDFSTDTPADDAEGDTSAEPAAETPPAEAPAAEEAATPADPG
jgi:tetratricopeptide (TPR) repeat protein